LLCGSGKLARFAAPESENVSFLAWCGGGLAL